ncbi:thiamine pyrophosphate-binding protein [Rhodococcus koreensis]
MKLYSVIGSLVASLDTDAMFGVMGDANLELVASFRDQGHRYVRAVHETGAVVMADAYFRASGRVGIATVTHGPGLTNAITGLTEAVRARSEVLLISGTTPPDPMDPGYEQRIDLRQVAATAGAIYEQVYTPASVGRDLTRALQRMRSERRPVLLDVPARMVHDDCPEPQTLEPIAWAGPRRPSESELDATLGLITSVNRPIIIAGRGAVVSDAAPSLVALAENIGALLGASVLAKDLFAREKRNIGIMGNLSHEAAQNALAEADCIICFGASLNSMTVADGDLIRGKKIVHVDLDPAAINHFSRADQCIVGDAKAVADTMNDVLRETGWTARHTDWVDRHISALASHSTALTDEHVADGFVDVRAAAAALNDALPTSFGVVSDVGRYNAGTWPYIHAGDPRDFLGISAFASIGLGVAGAIGAAVARPGLPIVLLVGDGGLMMSVSEISTAVRERLPIIVAVFNDDVYGFEYFRLERFGFDPDYSKNDFADFTGIAQGFGVPGRTVRSVDDIVACTDLWRAGLTGPVLLDVKIDPAHNLIQ